MQRQSLLLCALIAAMLGASCGTSTPMASAPSSPTIDPAKLVDLTYAFDQKTVYWPNGESFQHQKDTWAMTPGGYWYAAGEFSAAEHGGTHLDSPIHFSEGKQTVDQIPLSRLVAPAFVVDVSAQAAQNRDYSATREDVLAFEQANGMIPAGAIVIFRTGWGQYWPDKKQYLGNDIPGDTMNLHFPGIARDAAEILVERNVSGVGIDTASMDPGPSTDFIVHQVLNGANIYGLENVANAESLPPTGATIIALPMKIGEGTGAPTRIIAILP